MCYRQDKSLTARGLLDYRGVVSKRVPLSEAEATNRMLHKGCVSGRAVVEMALAQVN